MTEVANDIQVFVVNEGGFAPVDKDNFSSFDELGVDKTLESFVSKRLEHFGFNDYSFVSNESEIKDISAPYAAVINATNPFVDAQLLSKMRQTLKNHQDVDLCTVEGAIPGTEPDFLVRKEAWGSKPKDQLSCVETLSDTQNQYNCQVNLKKFKRIKIFKHLADNYNELATLNIDQLMKFLGQDDVFEKVISYCEDVKLVSYDQCPHCQGELDALKATVSQPMIGFIPDYKPYHYKCNNCQLIIVSPAVQAEDTYKLYDVYYKEGQDQQFFIKNKSRFPYYSEVIKRIEPLVGKNCTGLDLGSGAGTFISYVNEHCPSWDMTASDLPEAIKFFNYPEEIKTRALNFLKEPIGQNQYDLISTWEVVEHVPYPSFKSMLENVHSALTDKGLFVFSTPDFDSPFCRGWDFFNLCPPHHLLVYSRSWMKKYFDNNEQFELVDIFNESEFFQTYRPWFKYWAETSKNFESRAVANMFLEMLDDEQIGDQLKEFFIRKNWGIGMIVIVRKRG